VPTLIEWDTALPDFDTLLQEADRAAACRPQPWSSPWTPCRKPPDPGGAHAQALQLEQERQARLLAAIRAGHGPLPAGWTGHRVGLLAHQRHARATARRALAGAYPVLARWLGEAAFDTLAWWHWRRAPPRRGDLGTWGAALPAALAAGQALASDARAELARLEWAVHVAARAPDPVSGLPQGLDALQTTSPEALWLLPQPGLAVLPCGQQVLARWSAAQPMLPPAQGAQAAGGRGIRWRRAGGPWCGGSVGRWRCGPCLPTRPVSRAACWRATAWGRP
jgi:hypothetical protein